MKSPLLLTFGAVGALATTTASAATYQVGPDKPYRQLTELVDTLNPGDLVEVDGDASYDAIWPERPGTEAAPIVFKGVRVNGQRPRIEGGVEDGAYTLLLDADWYTFDGFEITGGTGACVIHRAHGIVIRDSHIHGCPRHGVLGTDQGSGSLTLSYVEVSDSGGEIEGENLKHPLYIATDELEHPGAVFRLEHSWIHDNNGGNNVKSRAERNEIHYNWIEGAQYYALELIGPADDTGMGPPREDSDVVGNVLISTNDNYAVRFGGDGTGASEGRVRMVNNTVVMGLDASGAIRCTDGLEALELYNNAFIRQTPWLGTTEGHEFFRHSECTWQTGSPVIIGSHNFVTDSGDITLPAELTDTVRGVDAGLRDFAMRDYRPLETSLLVNAGTDDVSSDMSPDDVLERPASVPPQWSLEVAGGAFPRDAVGMPDIGAYEFGSPTGEPGQGGNGGGEGPGPGPGGGGGGGGGAGCSIARPGRTDAGVDPGRIAVLLGGVALLVRRRR